MEHENEPLTPADTTPIPEKSVVKKVRKPARTTTKINSLSVRQAQGNLKKFISILEAAKQKDINESDTSNIVNDILGDVLGYDKFFDVTTEYKIKGQYADYGIRIDNKIYAFIEVKAINIPLNDQHLFQVASYAVHEGIDWAILTNGNVWRLYRVEDVKPVKLSLVVSIDLFNSELKLAQKIQTFAAFHKKNLISGYLESLWREKSCVNEDAIRKILRSKSGIDFIRKELKRQSGYRVEPVRIEEILNREILNES